MKILQLEDLKKLLQKMDVLFLTYMVAEELVLAALEDIRSKGLRVVPQCSFVEVYIRRHPEWADLVRTAESAKR